MEGGSVALVSWWRNYSRVWIVVQGNGIYYKHLLILNLISDPTLESCQAVLLPSWRCGKEGIIIQWCQTGKAGPLAFLSVAMSPYTADTSSQVQDINEKVWGSRNSRWHPLQLVTWYSDFQTIINPSVHPCGSKGWLWCNSAWLTEQLHSINKIP